MFVQRKIRAVPAAVAESRERSATAAEKRD
jgi:hypothetical protein